MRFSGTVRKATPIPIPSANNHPAILAAMVVLGAHAQKREIRKVETWVWVPYLAYAWELAETKPGTNERFLILGRFAINFHEKSGLVELLEGWRGRKYEPDELIDPAAVVGKPCLVNVTHGTSARGNPVAQIDSVSRLPVGTVPLQPQRELLVHSFTDDDGRVLPEPAALPARLATLPWLFGRPIEQWIKSSREWKFAKSIPLTDEEAQAEEHRRRALAANGGDHDTPPKSDTNGTTDPNDIPF
jgi:hypothetical protein